MAGPHHHHQQPLSLPESFISQKVPTFSTPQRSTDSTDCHSFSPPKIWDKAKASSLAKTLLVTLLAAVTFGLTNASSPPTEMTEVPSSHSSSSSFPHLHLRHSRSHNNFLSVAGGDADNESPTTDLTLGESSSGISLSSDDDEPPSPPFNLSGDHNPDLNFPIPQPSSTTTAITTTTTTASGNGSTATTATPLQRSLYTIVVPLMVFFCALTCIVNLIIVLSAKWCKKPMSPTLYYSISLALADAYAAFILGVGLLINSLLRPVYRMEISGCFSLVIEGFRASGMLVSLCHLLALGINHWIGIARPLHYASTMTRRNAWFVIILSWIGPTAVIFSYYALVPDHGDGFHSLGCAKFEFLRRKMYRLFFVSCVFVPLFLLCLLYIHIFLIVRRHHTNRQRFQSTQSLRKNVKAALTTVLILGTYVIGWIPATVYNIVVCDDCFISAKDLGPKWVYAIAITVNVLVILKTMADPVIYAARMSDIKHSLKKMKYSFLQTFCGLCCHSLPPPPADNDRGNSTTRTSMYDNNSIRMASYRWTNNNSVRRSANVNGEVTTSLIRNNHSPHSASTPPLSGTGSHQYLSSTNYAHWKRASSNSFIRYDNNGHDHP